MWVEAILRVLKEVALGQLSARPYHAAAGRLTAIAIALTVVGYFVGLPVRAGCDRQRDGLPPPSSPSDARACLR